MILSDGWTVDYGDGPRPAVIPHAWRQDMPVTWEGPARYSRTLLVPSSPSWLVFEGISYAARFLVNGEEIGGHHGIWDAFAIDLSPWKGEEISLTVEVIKNGGQSYPVPETAAGFIPYVFHTFGGIFRPVHLVESEDNPISEDRAETWVAVDGSRLYVQGEPFYMRGTLTWGWYPEIGHAHPSLADIRRELDDMQALGFNTVKFCLWLPPHEYLEEMRERGMMAWLELPIWMPKKENLPSVEKELERIVRQYRRHPNIAAWTVGCELGDAATGEWRSQMVEMVRELTGHPLIKDSSGGAEMYGGNPHDFGTFDDFHPYCDTHYFPTMLDSLLPGARTEQPILLGEFNDYDFCRDLSRVIKEKPYWADTNPDLNDQGVRWMHDLPAFLHHPDSRVIDHLDELIASSLSQGAFMRDFVQQAVRAREPISGYVVTGWRDTPISTAGHWDDWDEMRLPPESTAAWNGPDALFLIPRRSPPWINGGNRPAWEDPIHHWAGPSLVQVGLHSEKGFSGQISWQLISQGKTLASGTSSAEVKPLASRQVAFIPIESEAPLEAELHVQCGDLKRIWPIHIVEHWHKEMARLSDPRGAFFDQTSVKHPLTLSTSTRTVSRSKRTIHFLLDKGTLPRPFWRESCWRFSQELAEIKDDWHALLMVASDRVIDPFWLKRFDAKPLLTRVDTRTFEVTHAAALIETERGREIVTTLRPFGGLGVQPLGLGRNPAGARLIRLLDSLL